MFMVMAKFFVRTFFLTLTLFLTALTKEAKSEGYVTYCNLVPSSDIPAWVNLEEIILVTSMPQACAAQRQLYLDGFTQWAWVAPGAEIFDANGQILYQAKEDEWFYVNPNFVTLNGETWGMATYMPGLGGSLIQGFFRASFITD
jgi:hypothetical protein